jgi:hypothetical protein
MSAALVNEIIGWVAHAIYANNGEVSRAHRHLMGPLGGS